MNEVVFRKATSADMPEIHQLQLDVFQGEQRIPAALIPLPEKSLPQWWCAVMNGSVAGVVAAWSEHGQTHWGRFAIKANLRGLGIGTRLAQLSLDDLFSQQIEEIHMEARDATITIICRMGGKITGSPAIFYEGTVTPLILARSGYASKKK